MNDDDVSGAVLIGTATTGVAAVSTIDSAPYKKRTAITNGATIERGTAAIGGAVSAEGSFTNMLFNGGFNNWGKL